MLLPFSILLSSSSRVSYHTETFSIALKTRYLGRNIDPCVIVHLTQFCDIFQAWAKASYQLTIDASQRQNIKNVQIKRIECFYLLNRFLQRRTEAQLFRNRSQGCFTLYVWFVLKQKCHRFLILTSSCLIGVTPDNNSNQFPLFKHNTTVL